MVTSSTNSRFSSRGGAPIGADRNPAPSSILLMATTRCLGFGRGPASTPIHTHDGRKFRILNVVDEFTRECLAIRVGRKLKGADVIDVLSDLFILRGVPAHVRSDNVLRSDEGRLARQQVSVREHAPAVCLSSTSIQAAPADPEELSAIANTGSSRCTRHRGPHRPQHEMSIQAGDPSIIYRVVVLTPSRLC